MRKQWPVIVLIISIAGASRTAFAYDTGSLAGAECHENLTRRAMADARDALGLESPPFPADIDANALLSDLPFEMDAGEGFDTVVTVLANREVDLAGLEPREIDRLAQIHGADQNQPEHCLRRSMLDDPNGSELALEECRAYIRDQLALALDEDDETRVSMSTSLRVRGSIDLSLPQRYVALGRALHALQDGFSHSYRTEDGSKVIAVLNYVDLVEDRLDPSVDGPAHSQHLDECADLDPLRERRWELATEASTELAMIALDPDLSRADKDRAVDELLARHLSFQAGCDAENEWCGAPEADFADPEPCTCTHTTSRDHSWLWLLGALSLLMLRRRSRTTLALAAALFILTPSTAKASDFGLYVSGSGAIMNTALATSVGGRYTLSDNWVFGLDAEWNPWIGGGFKDIRAGSINAYATIIFRIPMRTETVNLRTTLQLGASRIMFDLVGVAEGSIGPYVGLNVLGVEWRFADDLFLVIDPAHISVPIPQITGVPFAFPQYRVTLGLQWGG